MSDIYDLHTAAAKHFAPRGACVSDVHLTLMSGVPVLGSIFPETFGRAAFSSFTVELPQNNGVTEAFEVTMRRGRPTFEVVHDRPVKGWFGQKVERQIHRPLTTEAAKAKLGLA